MTTEDTVQALIDKTNDIVNALQIAQKWMHATHDEINMLGEAIEALLGWRGDVLRKMNEYEARIAILEAKVNEDR